tara:strand:- start:100 stop:291 length:192 start_codon:yes stop_codon:yes gene_type:complete
MPLSAQVEDSLRESQLNLKNALAFSARNEESYVSKHIADMLLKIDTLIDAHDMLENLKNELEG